jgi:hypothetical protein
MSAYAFLNEIWNSEESSVKTSPQCTLKTGKLDNIMDAYMSETKNIVVNEEQEKPCHVDVDNLEGWDNSNILKNAYSIANDFDNDVALMTNTPPIEEEADPYCEEEHIPKPYVKKEIYNNIIEKYNNTNQQSDQSYFIELIIYVLSGIFLIFLMEQILQIGKHLKI